MTTPVRVIYAADADGGAPTVMADQPDRFAAVVDQFLAGAGAG